jgi:hypothetical protein
VEDQINPKKCYSCGKLFKLVTDLQRHKNRKTPCLIREVSPRDILNPNRCIFCNKILLNKSSLIRHLKTCKIKNGGMNILDEKVRHEEAIRILNERDHVKEREINDIKEENRQMREEMERIKDQLKQLPIVPDIADVKTYNNGNNNTNIGQINFYNYDTPRLDTLKISQDDLLVESISKKLLEMIYFNHLLPENHTLYRPNIRDQRLLVYKDGDWHNIAGAGLTPVFDKVKDLIFYEGSKRLDYKGGIYADDDGFAGLHPVVREAIRQFHSGGDKIVDGTIMEIITENREIVKATIDAMTKKVRTRHL